jgi:hypothetical protein
VLLLAAICLALPAVGSPQVTKAQASITIEGVLEAVNGNTWVVSGITVEVGTATIVQGQPTIGKNIRVVAVRGANGHFIAQNIIIIIINATPAATPEATNAPEATQPPEATPESTAQPGTTVINITNVNYVIIIIEGPVTEVDPVDNIIVVYGYRIRMRGDDPLRIKVKVGDWVRVKGHWKKERGQIIFIAITVIVIIDGPVTIIIVPASNGGGGNNNNGNNGNGKGDKKGKDDDD